MAQTRARSGLEAVLNVVSGYGLAFAAQLAMFPVFGLSVTLPQSLGLGFVFAGLSLIRSYVLRRLFDRLDG